VRLGKAFQEIVSEFKGMEKEYFQDLTFVMDTKIYAALQNY